MEKLRVFLGWDDREKIAYEVCEHSIKRHSGVRAEVIPLCHKPLRKQGFFTRPWEVNAQDGNYRDLIDGRPFSTQFSHTRFLVPELMKFKGWALFADCDMIFRCPIEEIFNHTDDKYAIMCVKHRQKIDQALKMDGAPQAAYHRKNWSSFVLWNCEHPLNKQLTKEFVNTKTGAWLHGFEWLRDNHIGALPREFNWIEKSSPSMEYPKVIHYTEGGPWFKDYQDVIYGDVWLEYYHRMMRDDYNPIVDMVVDYKGL